MIRSACHCRDRVPILAAAIGLWCAGQAAAQQPAGDAAGQAGAVSFVNDVLPVLSKAGCNQGTCHGAAAGKGGFKLSLRGYAPELDYRAIVREMSSRRVDLLASESSLLLKKPSAAVPHRGGRVLPAGSPAYRIVADWLRQGAAGPDPHEARPVALSIRAAGARLEPGERAALSVEARFSDGQVRDVTAWARYDTNAPSVATVDSFGTATAAGPGKAAVSAAYQDLVAAVEITVPFEVGGLQPDYAGLPRHNYIDDLVIEAWQSLKLGPSPIADDATFFRRAHLDLAGILPEPQEIQAFLADTDPHKRAAAVDRLLERPEFVDLWTHRWGEVLRLSREWLGEKSMWTFHTWLREQIATNRPFNEIAAELVAGAGDSSMEGPPNFYRLQKVYNEPELWPLTAAETTAQTFLGIRTQCARCHNHPFDRWTQDDYYGMAAFFAQVAAKSLGDGQVVVFDRREGEIPHPRLGSALPPKFLAGPVVLGGEQTRRAQLADWIAAPENPYFARVTANRLWRYMMGRGLVEPVDDLRTSNPPTNAALLAAMADDLVEHGFDLKHLLRRIANSRVYQLSSTPTQGNGGDEEFYSWYRPKRLPAEQILDALGKVTGKREKFAGLPAGFRAQELPDTRVASKFLDMFGRPLRRVASCECERLAEPNLGQALELLNSGLLDERVTTEGSLVDRLLSQGVDDAAMLDEIYLRAVGRLPAEGESRALLAQLPPGGGGQGAGAPATAPTAESPDPTPQRRQFFEDVLWALLNSKEFLFNH